MTALWQEVGDRIFRRRYESLDLNIGLIITDESVVVIDSRANHRQADELRADLARLTRLPVSTLINTHFHWDHTFGNARFSEATLIGHERARSALVERGEQMKLELIASDWVPAEARPLFEEVVITPPEETFTIEMGLMVGGRHLELRHLGRGHTDSDIVILADDLVFAGDLVEEGAPPSFGDSHPREWVDTLDRLVPLVTGTVVPGHGDVVDVGFIRGQRDEIAAAIAALELGAPEEGPYPPAVMESISRRMTLPD